MIHVSFRRFGCLKILVLDMEYKRSCKTNCVPDFVTNLDIPTINDAVEFNVKTSVHEASIVSKKVVVKWASQLGPFL